MCVCVCVCVCVYMCLCVCVSERQFVCLRVLIGKVLHFICIHLDKLAEGLYFREGGRGSRQA